MLDTGAQVTVVGSRIAARLQLNPAAPEFEVEIEGVTGDVTMAPGFYVDTLEIPALGQWFKATHVPVVLMDISSPEGGTLDGIIGMNLFVDFNLIVRGGGLFLDGDPTLELQRVATKHRHHSLIREAQIDSRVHPAGRRHLTPPARGTIMPSETRSSIPMQDGYEIHY